MAGENNVPLGIELKDQQARTALDEFTRSLQSATQQMTTALKGVEKTYAQTQGKLATVGKEAAGKNGAGGLLSMLGEVKGALGAVAASYAVLKGAQYFREAINASAEAQQGLLSFNQALKASGDYSEDVSKEVQTLAGRIQRQTTVQDDAVISGAAYAKNLGLTNDQMKKVIKAAVQLSAVTGNDLQYSVQQLSLTYDGQIGRLGRAVPALRGMTEEQLRAGKAVEFVNERFKGTAEALTNSFGGAVTQVSNAMGEVFEKIGDIIVQNPQVVKVIKMFTEFLFGLAEKIEENMDMLIAWTNTLMGPTLFAISLVIRVITFLITGFKNLIYTMKAVQDVIFGVLTFFLEFKIVNAILSGVVKVIAAIVAVLVGMVDALAQLPGVSTALEKMGLDIKGFHKTLKDTQPDVKKFISDFDFSKTANSLNKTRQELQGGFVNALEVVSEKGDQLADVMQNVGADMYGAGVSGLEKLGAAGEKTFKKLKPLPENLKEAFEKLKGEIAKVGLSNVEIVEKEFAARVKLLNEVARYGVNIEETMHKVRMDYQKKLTEAQKKDAEELAKKQKELADKLKDNFANPFKWLFQKFDVSAMAAGIAGALNMALQGGAPDLAAKKDYAQQRSTLLSQRDETNATIDREFAKQKAELDKQLAARIIDERMYAAKMQELEAQTQEKRLDAQVQYQKDAIKAEQDYQKNLENARKGYQDKAAKMLSSLAAAAADKLIPGLGQIVGPLFEALAKGPEEVKAMIKGLIDAIPEVIKNVILSIPAVIEALIDGIPDLIDALVDAAPDVIMALVEKAPDIITKLVEKAPMIAFKLAAAMPMVGVKLIEKLLEGAPQFIGKLVEGAQGFVGKILEGAAQFVQKIIDGIGNIGGNILNPAGRGGGSIIPGVNIVPDNIPIVGGWFKGGAGGAAAPATVQAAGDQTQEMVIKIGEQEMARIIYNLQRRGHRLA